jgi:hypothetical protein
MSFDEHAMAQPRGGSKPFDEFIVSFVSADPKPDHLFAMATAQRPITDADPDRVDGFRLVDALEMKALIVRV